MANEHLYATVDDVRRYMRVEPGNSALDAFIASQIDPVSRMIDRHCRRWFYAVTATRYFDFQDSRRLWLDADLLTVTKMTNGDGHIFASNEYFLMPNNGSKFHWIDINDAKGVSFSYSETTQKCISIEGTWGYSTVAPIDINRAVCVWIAMLSEQATDRGISSKSIGDYSVSYNSAVNDQVTKIPVPVVQILDRFVRRGRVYSARSK